MGLIVKFCQTVELKVILKKIFLIKHYLWLIFIDLEKCITFKWHNLQTTPPQKTILGPRKFVKVFHSKPDFLTAFHSSPSHPAIVLRFYYKVCGRCAFVMCLKFSLGWTIASIDNQTPIHAACERFSCFSFRLRRRVGILKQFQYFTTIITEKRL